MLREEMLGCPPWVSCLHSERPQGFVPAMDAGLQFSCFSASGSLPSVPQLSSPAKAGMLPVLAATGVGTRKGAVGGGQYCTRKTLALQPGNAQVP